MRLKGWIEHGGVRLTPAELERMLAANPESLARCGGEFLIEWDDCTARDNLGIMPGPAPPGNHLLRGRPVGG